ncbi:MAG: hypothetical protein M1826_000999 [Phylliscum demangeonii]|nr:MAG: hypothetical protein M1826_000999 [Phylliscum demangeonii]
MTINHNDADALPAACSHYARIGDAPWDLQHYWKQRRQIFHRYDQGIWMTDEAWYGVTPEAVANKIADDLSRYAPSDRTILIDAFSGVGGNTIAFARSNRWKHIFAVEKDGAAIRCAKHNASVYGVQDRIRWIHGDVFEVLRALPAATRKHCLVFASPPWGGPTYRSARIFDLATMCPYSLEQIYGCLRELSDHVVLYLPRSSDLRQLARLVPDEQKIRVVHYCLYRASKALCAYLGRFSPQLGEDEPWNRGRITM